MHNPSPKPIFICKGCLQLKETGCSFKEWMTDKHFLGEQEDIPVSLSSLHVSCRLLTAVCPRTEKDLFFSLTDIHRHVSNGV